MENRHLATVTYLNAALLQECTNGEEVIAQTPALSFSRSIVQKYFGIPLKFLTQNIVGSLKDFYIIQGAEVSAYPKVASFASVSFGNSDMSRSAWPPSIIGRTQHHLLVMSSAQQVSIAKTISGIVGVFLFFFLAILFGGFAFIGVPFYFYLVPTFIGIVFFANAYLLFRKSSFILIAPISALKRGDGATQMIVIDGEFKTGIPSFKTTSITGEFYIGENYDAFMQGISAQL